MVKARTDRRPFGVTRRRGCWHGWHYDRAGKRIANVRLFDPDSKGLTLEPLRVLTKNPEKCPNKFKALQQIKEIWERSGTIQPAVPPFMQCVEAWHKSLSMKGKKERSSKLRIQTLCRAVEGVFQVGRRKQGAPSVPLIEGLKIDDIRDLTEESFNAFLERLAEQERGATTRNDYLAIWRAFCEFAVKRKWIKENPLLAIEFADDIRPRRPRRPYTKEEFERIIAEAPREDSLYYLCLGCSGLRRDESLKVVREYLDPCAEKPIWKLPRWSTKNAREALIPMMPRLASALRHRWLNTPPGGLLFPAPPPLYALNKLLRKLGIAKVNAAGEWLNFHSFRYTFADQLAERCSMREVQFFMRHEDFAMTTKLYAKLQRQCVLDRLTCPDF